MSEYQYYEFQAIDRPLSAADRQALRDLSTRARITPTSFTNSYEWGDFRGDPRKLMEQWFDLHLYLANWGSRRLMMRLPARLVDRKTLNAFLTEVDFATLKAAGGALILDIQVEEVDLEDGDDGSGWLAMLAPLRADVLAGDLRLFYLLWLTAVDADVFLPDAREPLPGIGPLTGALEAFAEFIVLDRDLVAAAAERGGEAMMGTGDASRAAHGVVAAMSEAEKTGFLVRLIEGDAHVPSELRALVRQAMAPPAGTRTVGELRARAEAIRAEREQAIAEQAAADRLRRQAIEDRLRRARLDGLIRRGESVWQDIDAEIERRNASGYDRAIGLILDLEAIAVEQGQTGAFAERIGAIRERHARKARFIERLMGLAED